jgi:hypothetical protein
MEERFVVGAKARMKPPKHKALVLCLLVALGLGMLGPVAPARGEGTTLTVDRQDDPDPSAAGTCTAASEDCSLRGAIVTANSTAEAETINVPAGIYTLTIVGPSENASATGDLDASNVTIRGGGARRTEVVGGAGFDDRIFDLRNATVSSLTISGGKALSSFNDFGRFGGGIKVDDGDVTLDKVSKSATLPWTAVASSSGGILR